ncbi:Wzz/FepE/Etk N-terminal domain-containing protein [Nitrospiraceae bacterium AH_259_D15_M11_P09]|nr:Wzz/FepE/Etk N-terminal domain-containing protein [Nitrospiraceae bacterium AH_259_D15_M11_P09]
MTQLNQADPPQGGFDDEVNLLDYWRVIWKRRWLIGGLCATAVLTAMVVSLQMPKIYESTATLLPQVGSKGGGGLGALLAASGAQSFGISLPGMPATPTDIFVAMLKSRTMADEVIKELNLMELYKAKTMGGVRNALEGATKIKVRKEKVIAITVESRDPHMAADIANFYVTNLDRLNRTLNVSKVSQNRAFIEQRLDGTRVNLVRAEEAVKEFQVKNKAVAVEAQSQAMFAAAVQVQAQISAQEVELQVMRSYLSPDNPELARVRSSIEEYKKQLRLLESGKNGKGMLPGDRLHPAMITVPTLALDYGRLVRDLKVQETLYAMLTSQYEQAKIAEARDTPTVQVLDPAIPAEMKSKPRIRLNMMIAGVLALFLSIFLAFFLEYLDRIRAQSVRTEV